MNTKENSLIVTRRKFLTILQAAFDVKEYQFARQSILIWLKNYPGDLYIKFLYGKILTLLNDFQQSLKILEECIKYDPEFLEAYQILIKATNNAIKADEYKAIISYLQQKAFEQKSEKFNWLENLAKAHKLLEEGQTKNSEKFVLASLASNSNSPLPAILHSHVVWQMNNPALFKTLTSIYQKRWPDCIQFRIFAALSLLENNNDVSAVENLHWSAAHDVNGQVVHRILGYDHKFIPLWPEKLQIYFELPIPASITSQLGLNQIGGFGSIEDQKFNSNVITDVLPNQTDDKEADDFHEVNPKEFVENSVYELESADNLNNHMDEIEMTDNSIMSSLDEIQSEFDRIAKNLKKSALSNADTRFPSYIVMTSIKALQEKYGINTADVIKQNLEELVLKITGLPNWNSLLFIPDDPNCTSQIGLQPVLVNDAWKVKLALHDLDEKLSSKGEMIGALLIIGGNDIIPFHQLPNPTDDMDTSVPSDNPYASVDENYFIPQWPVGRMPDEKGTDAAFLLEQIRFLNNEYAIKIKSSNKPKSPLFIPIFDIVSRFLRRISDHFHPLDNFGYAAEVWKLPSDIVFKVIDSKKKITLAPPTDFSSLPMNSKSKYRCAYFNLHGLKDSPEWFGQKDLAKDSNEPEFPVALIPSQFNQTHAAPEIVFTEACYGNYIVDKESKESMALNFMANGSRVVVGSTCVAYGSVQKPLIAADLLAEEFWKQVQNGVAVGYALLRSKLNLAREMTDRQGYLDGEDQKTILSFVLLGDPLATLQDFSHIAKPLLRPKAQPKLNTISDSTDEVIENQEAMPKEILSEVRKVVSAYLPGLTDAQLSMNPQLTNFTLPAASGKNRTFRRSTVKDSQRFVIMLKKSFEKGEFAHHQYARMTFDNKGQMIKLSISH